MSIPENQLKLLDLEDLAKATRNGEGFLIQILAKTQIKQKAFERTKQAYFYAKQCAMSASFSTHPKNRNVVIPNYQISCVSSSVLVGRERRNENIKSNNTG